MIAIIANGNFYIPNSRRFRIVARLKNSILCILVSHRVFNNQIWFNRTTFQGYYWSWIVTKIWGRFFFLRKRLFYSSIFYIPNIITYVYSKQQTYSPFHVIKHSLEGPRFRHTANKGLGHWVLLWTHSVLILTSLVSISPGRIDLRYAP